MQGNGPPTCPPVESSGSYIVAAAQHSVCPYPSSKGQQKLTFKKFTTSTEIGADPVIMNLTFPPNIALNLEQTTLS
jgi:hypothetical protein